MATGVDIKRDGNGNPALADTLFGNQGSRLKVGVDLLQSAISVKGKELFSGLGYHDDETEYLMHMGPFLTLKPASESSIDAIVYKASQDDKAYTRNVTFRSPRTGLVNADFNRGSGEYRRQHPQEAVFDDHTDSSQPADRVVAKFLILGRHLGEDEEELKKILKNEHEKGFTLDSKNPFASLIRAMKLAAVYGLDRDHTGLTTDIKTVVNHRDGRTSKQIWREVSTNPESVILGKVAHIH